MISRELLDILACPECKGDIEEKENRVICLKCGRNYPIKDDIPIMLVEESTMPEKNSTSPE